MYSVIKHIVVLILAILSVTTSSYAADKSVGLPLASPSPSSSQTVPPAVVKSPPAKTKSAEQSCRNLFLKFGVPWQQLWQKRGPELRDEHTGGLSQIADMSAEHCSEENTRKDVVTLLAKLLNRHNGKIGLLLPLATKPLTKHILRGVDAAIRAAQLDHAKILITADTQSTSVRVEQLLAALLFRDQVTTVIAGYEASEIEVLKQWSTKLLVPIFILNEPQVTTDPTQKTNPAPMTFYSHPTERGLARAMLAANYRYRHKKVSIMRPNDQHSDNLVRQYEQLAKAAGVTVLQSVVYDPKRFDQMESAAKRLFKLEANERSDELKRLYEKAKAHAAATGQTFNPKMVALQPVVEQDAVLIADDFRTVRHMAKVFTYLGVRKLPMFGAYDWRSEGLVEPYDPFFTGSYFVDFMGSYLTLPAPLRVPTTTSSYFIAPDRIEEVDFSILGYRSAIAPIALTKHTDTARRKLDTWIPRTTGKSQSKEINFDDDNVISWPTYLFEITAQGKNGTITLQP